LIRRWPWPLRVLHWLTAGLVAVMVPAALAAQALTETATDRAEDLVSLHILCGLAVLALTLVRLALRLYFATSQTTPPAPVLARLRSILFYALLLVLPLTGIFKLILSGLDVMAFGHSLIAAGGHAPDLARRLNSAHAWLAWSLLALIALHASAALWHVLRLRKGSSAQLQARSGSQPRNLTLESRSIRRKEPSKAL